MKRQLFVLIWVALALFFQSSLSSCKKDNSGSSDTDEQEALLKDSTYYFSLVYSLWNESLPMPQSLSEERLDLRRFTRSYSTAENVLEALVNLMPTNPRTKQSYDRFSFIDRQGQVGEEIGQGLHRDIGVSLGFQRLTPSSDEVGLRIRLIQKNSPAAQVQLTRGLQIVRVDGGSVRFTANNNGDVQGDLASYYKIMSGDVRTLSVRDWDGRNERTVNIPASGSYIIDPIVVKKTITQNNKQVGYIAYDSFVSVSDNRSGGPNRYYNEMVDAFRGLETVDELIVDLRYNGGGAGNAAELMTNLIAPTSADGSVMYKYVINDILRRAGLADESRPNAPFAPKYIDKTDLPILSKLSKVYFLVTRNTASASELLINSLKPHIAVEIISSADGTYGKPVGSFQQPVLNGYADLYITSFKTVNAAGNGDYFDGIAANRKNISDDLDRELGDTEENLLWHALYHIEYSTYPSGQRSSSQSRAGSGRGQVIGGEVLNLPDIEQSIKGLYIFDKVHIN